MKEIICIVILSLSFLSCKYQVKSDGFKNTDNLNGLKGTYTLDSSNVIEIPNNREYYIHKKDFQLDRFVKSISKEEYLKLEKEYRSKYYLAEKYNSNKFSTQYGMVEWSNNDELNDDSYQKYTYLRFDSIINKHIVLKEKYGGSMVLLIDDTQFVLNYIVDDLCYNWDKSKVCVSKNEEGLFGYIDFYSIDKNILKYEYTLWSDSIIPNEIIWSKENELLVSAMGNNYYVINPDKIKKSEFKSSNFQDGGCQLLEKKQLNAVDVINNMTFSRNIHGELEINTEILNCISRITTKENSGYLLALEDYVIIIKGQ